MIKKLFRIDLVRFLLTGGLNTAFGFAMYSLFIYTTNNAFLSVILSNVVGVLFNFKSYGTLVFKSHDNSRIFRFIVSYIVTIMLQLLTLKGLFLAGVENAYYAGAIMTLPMAALSFLIMKKFVYSQPNPAQAAEGPANKL